jgi:hypothetical protein
MQGATGAANANAQLSELGMGVCHGANDTRGVGRLEVGVMAGSEMARRSARPRQARGWMVSTVTLEQRALVWLGCA